MQPRSESSSEEKPVSFKSDTTRKVFDSLVDFFIEDYMVKKYVAEKSGWRTLAEIAEKSHISPSILYGKHSTLGPALDEPVRRGLIETRIFPGERGRGGEVMRLRIAYDKEPIRDFVNRKVMLGRNAIKTMTEQKITATQTLLSSGSIQSDQEVEENGQRKIAVIMFTDIVGYTALAQSDERQALEVLERHNRLLRPFFPKYHGREVKKIGDSFLVEFDSALDAANCGIEIQKFLHDYNISTHEDWKIKLRIGIHLGDVVRKGKDILGDAVNIASRIQPVADPEGICVSQQVFDQIHNKIAYSMEQLEHPELKNVKFATNAYTVLMPWQERTRPAGVERTITEGERRRIAVLPFSNMSPDANDEYFADGMTEELISTISKIGELQVIARTSVMGYKDEQKKKIEDIARELKVGTILEGSVRKAGDKIRVTAQLIDCLDSKHLWSETYDRELKDVFAIQSDISKTVANALRVRLLPLEKHRVEKAPTNSTEAYVLYLKGRQSLHERTKEGMEMAIDLFQKAVRIDPSYALAYSGLADAYTILGEFQYIPSLTEAFPKAEIAAKEALRIDENLAEAHVSMSSILGGKYYDHINEEKELRRAMQLDPSYAQAHLWYGRLLTFLGRFDEALDELRMTLRLDPISFMAELYIARISLFMGQVENAIEQFHELTIRYPSKAFMIQAEIGMVYFLQGNYEGALAQSRKVVELSPPEERSIRQLVYRLDVALTYTKMGRMEEAFKMVREFEEEITNERISLFAVNIAQVYLALRDNDRALQWLDRGYSELDRSMVSLKVDPTFNEFRTDPRFIALLRKIGLMSPEEALAAEKKLQRT